MSNVVCALLLATLSMRDAINRAVAHSPEIRALEAQVAQARANMAISDAFRPAASISTTPGYATGLPTAVLGQVPAIATIEAHKVFYDTSARAEVVGAQSEVEAAEARLEARKREVAQNAAYLYARTAADAALVADAHRRVDAYQTIASHVEALRPEGRARDIDVSRSALQLAGANRSLLLAQSRMEMNQLRLERMTGESVTPHPAFGHPLPVGEGSERATDPQVRAYDRQIAALQGVLAAESRLFKPTLAAQIQYSRLFDRYGRFYLNFKPDDFSAAASISLPIWTSGRKTAAIARVNAQLEELTAMRDARKTEIELAAREAETDLKQAEAERDLAQRTLSVAQEGLRVTQDLAREGRGEVNDVPLSQIAVADAEDDLANAEGHVAAAQARLGIVRGDSI